MCSQEVESCDCVDEETECTGVQGGGADTTGVECNSSEQFAISVITDTGETCRTLLKRCHNVMHVLSQEVIVSLQVIDANIDTVRQETHQLADTYSASDLEVMTVTFRLLEERFVTLQKDAHNLLSTIKV